MYRHVQSHIRWNNRSHNWAKLGGNIDLTGAFEDYTEYIDDVDGDDGSNDNDDDASCMRNIHKLVLFGVHSHSNISLSQSSIPTNAPIWMSIMAIGFWYLTRFIHAKFTAYYNRCSTFQIWMDWMHSTDYIQVPLELMRCTSRAQHLNVIWTKQNE